MSREVLSFDAGWRFHLGDVPMPDVKGHQATYLNAKAGNAGGAAGVMYDDLDWRVLSLPHDWAVEGPIDETANLSQGFLKRGFGWYRKRFRLSESDRGKHLELRFGGASSHATVWVNGTVVHRNHCGYVGFDVDLTPMAVYGDEVNTVAVRVDAETQEGWWYEGAGLYRSVTLVKRNALHVATDGVSAMPRLADGEAFGPRARWSVPAVVEVRNIGDRPEVGALRLTLADPDGKTVFTGAKDFTAPALAVEEVALPFEVTAPALWDLDAPRLYTLRVEVLRGGAVVDETLIRPGFRAATFDKDLGFFLNGRSLKIQGTCNHQDHAGVGVAVPPALWDFRVRRLKSLGSNAYRVSHHPAAEELLDVCDRLGMMVMDENRHFNSSPDVMAQLRWMVKRDRNRPSVILWSVFNEEPVQGTEIGYQMVRRMAAEVKRMDPTRPVTAAMNGGFDAELSVAHAVDVVGFNYCQDQYDGFRTRHPGFTLLSSEDTSAFMTRGEYASDPARHILASNDLERAKWGATHRDSWKEIQDRSWIAGGFVWTGFDYRGEPTPFGWPSTGSYFGIFDQCGFDKVAADIHRAQWIHDRPFVGISPHWTWPGREGKNVDVMVMTNAAKVELRLNGKSLGEQAGDRVKMNAFAVPYAPGRLEAIAKDADGREVARTAVDTAGPAAALRLVADRAFLDADGRDAVPVRVEAVDAEGRVVPDADHAVAFAVTEAATGLENLGVGNGDPVSAEPSKASTRRLFHGLAQIIVGNATRTGTAVLRADAEGLKGAEVKIDVRPALMLAPVPGVLDPVLRLENFHRSPPTATPQDPRVEVAANDMNSWLWTSPGQHIPLRTGRHALLRAVFRPYSKHRREGGEVVFEKLAGKAVVYLDGTEAARKNDEAPASLAFRFGPSERETRQITVQLEIDPTVPAGLLGRVVVKVAG